MSLTNSFLKLAADGGFLVYPCGFPAGPFLRRRSVCLAFADSLLVQRIKDFKRKSVASVGGNLGKTPQGRCIGGRTQSVGVL